MAEQLDLSIPEHAYIIGLFQADGNLYQAKSGGKGKFSLELSRTDKDILDKVERVLESMVYIGRGERDRVTNFGEMCAAKISMYEAGFREQLAEAGVLPGKKSRKVLIANVPVGNLPHYFRGWVDGDGSLGFTKSGEPFVSLVTASESIAYGFVEFLKRVTGRTKRTSRNKRDGVFNIMVMNELAVKVAGTLYLDGCIAMQRKAELAEAIQEWQREDPGTREFFERRRWTKEEDKCIMTHDIEESMALLNRTKSSIEMRLWRLQNREKH